MAGSALADPRRAIFKDAYLNPISRHFGNAYQSALYAGFSRQYARKIVSPSDRNKWVEEIVRDRELLDRAEENLRDFVGITDTEGQRFQVKADITKFVAKTLGRQKYGEQKNDQPIQVNVGVVVLPPLSNE